MHLIERQSGGNGFKAFAEVAEPRIWFRRYLEPHDRGSTSVRQNDRFSELSTDHNFPLENRLLAVRNTRFEKQSSIYLNRMSKVDSSESAERQK
jgi:hypothetical protein